MAHEYNCIHVIIMVNNLFVLHESIVHSNINIRGNLNYTVKAIQRSHLMNLTESTPPLFLSGVRFQYFGTTKTKLYDALDSWYLEFTIIINNLLLTLICMLSVK